MSWTDGVDDGELEPGWDDPAGVVWPVDWRELAPRERWAWFEQIWTDTCALRERYRLPVRAGWWEDPIQLEMLAALAAWVAHYDSGTWVDPPGKVGMLFELERIAGALRDGREPFHPGRDWPRFANYVIREAGGEPPLAQ